ncbi:DUF6541 family protein [Actinosynnema sp. NPDC047251]|uniref:Uncharacterized protein n=1 Tax=Saccharothrix espanaensis (strain ATCC 51144 / DSM 44229 / JCM 9112 / NBRC 15066 / NRRL 15764) TaxID=1179773 RepID=K0JRQ8_SACES|nr:DUF6541 family protein [Saccharothrix espanaensis]CCH27494.1 hypothetical protein BN6_01610 [Saccharothrix espanaensis DSM 44229]
MSAVLVLLLCWLPGLVFGLALGLRGWVLAAGAPAFTYGLVSLGGLLLGQLGVSWTLLTFGAWALVASVLALVATLVWRRLRGPAQPAPDQPAEDVVRRSVRDNLVVVAGLAVGLAVGVVTYLRGIGSLSRLSQDWDAPHHGNLIRWFAEHQSSVVANAGMIGNQPDSTSYFYPSTYHKLLALLLDQAGLGMPELLNSGALVTVVSWPIGIAAMGLAWRLSPLTVAFAAAVSTWFSPFPYDSLWRGPLWPYLAGIALLPALLALTRLLFEPRGITGPVAIAVVLAGLVGLHTSLAFIVFGLYLVILVSCAFRWTPIDWRRAWPSLVAVAVLGVLAAVPMILPALGNAAGVTAAIWNSEATPAGALGQTITFSGVVVFPQWWIGPAAFAGMWCMVRQRLMLWLVAAYVVFGGLYAATVSLESPLIHKLTGPFYNDHWRLAVMLPLFGSISFGVFVVTFGGWLVGKWGARLPAKWPAGRVAVAASLVLFLVIGVMSGAYVKRNVDRLAQTYQDGPTVSSGEQDAYRWLAQRVRPGERVMNDVTDGSAWMYAVAKVEPVVWSFYGAPDGSTESYLVANLRLINVDPKVREGLDRLKVRYVILGKGFVRPWGNRARGLYSLPLVKGFHQVYRTDDATIYEIEGQQDVATSPAPAGR